jgi:hypothetical protein
MMYRIEHPQLFKRNIIWINGPSASGKTTLMRRLLKLPNLHVCDTDIITDKLVRTNHETPDDPSQGRDDDHSEKVFDAIKQQLLATPKHIVFVGLTVQLYGITSHLFAIGIDPELNYVQSQRRELGTLCDNKSRVLEELHTGDNLNARINKLTSEIEARTPVIVDPHDYRKNNERFQLMMRAHGFDLMSADSIFDRVSELTV